MRNVYNSLSGNSTGDETTSESENETPEERLKQNIATKKINCMKKYRMSKKLAHTIKTELTKEGLDDEEELEVLVAALTRLGIKSKDLKNITTKSETRGRKMTSMEEKLNMWTFWHENTEASTLTSRPAKLRTDKLPKIQKDLKFHDGVKLETNKCKIKLYVSTWLLTTETLRVLYQKYKKEFNSTISLGTFRALWPFYARSPTGKDIEMCVCIRIICMQDGR